MGMAGGILIHALTGIPYHYGMTVILSICVGYTLLGGLRAVIGTDFIQALLILSGAVTIAVLAIGQLGLETIHAAVLTERPELLNLLMPASIMFLFNNLLFGVGEIFHSNVWWSRAFAFREGVGFRACVLAGLLWAPIPVVAGFVALATPALGLNVPAADMVGPMVAAQILGATGAVLVLIMVFAALSSSIDSLLAATSILVVEDIYRRHLKPDATAVQMRRATARIIVGLGILTWILCAPRLTTLAELLYFTGAFVASTIWPIAAGLFWQRANATGAIGGMILGSVAGLYSYFAVGFYVAALVGAAVSMTMVIVTSFLRAGEFDFRALQETHPREALPGTGGST
jgi:Na+/proline symporter